MDKPLHGPGSLAELIWISIAGIAALAFTATMFCLGTTQTWWGTPVGIIFAAGTVLAAALLVVAVRWQRPSAPAAGMGVPGPKPQMDFYVGAAQGCTAVKREAAPGHQAVDV
jgi:hypothetical protein